MKARALLGVWLMAGLAHAQDGSPPAPAQGALAPLPAQPEPPAPPATLAERAFLEGVEAFDRGDDRAAIGRWSVALRDGDPQKSWRVHYNLGLAHERLGERPAAVVHYEAFFRRVAEEPGTLPIAFEERRQDAVDRAARLRQGLALLRVNAPASTERVTVRVGDGEPQPAGFARYLEPGTYLLTMGEGARAKTREVTLGAGELVTLTAEQLPPPPPPTPVREPLIHPGVLIGGGSLAVMSLALPIGLFFHTSTLRDRAEAVPRVDPSYPALLDDFETARTAYQASWAVPALIGASTLGLLIAELVDAGEGPEIRSQARLRSVHPLGLEVAF